MFGMPTLGKALLWLGTSVFILKCREGPRNIVVARYGYDGLPPSRVLGGFSFLGLCSLKIKFRRKASLNFLSRGKPYLVRGHHTHTKVAPNPLNSPNYRWTSRRGQCRVDCQAQPCQPLHVTATGWGNMSGDSDWVSVSEAARRIGVTRAAIYSRVARKTLETMTDNHGHTLVRVPMSGDSKASGGTLRKASPDTLTRARPDEPEPTHSHGASSEAVLPVSTAMNMLAEQAALHRADIDTLRARHDGEIARRLAERDALHADTLARLQTQASLERAPVARAD